jgi:hypothetical protein
MADTLQMLQHKIQFQAYDIESEDWQVSMHADTASDIHHACRHCIYCTVIVVILAQCTSYLSLT